MHRGDEDHHGHHGQRFGLAFDAREFATPFSAASDVIPVHYPSFAKGGPGAGGGAGGGSGGTTLVWTTGYNDGVLDSDQYNIQITFKGTWDSSQVQMVQTIATNLSNLITADVQDVLFKGKVIDDLSLTIELKTIDGIGGILGQAGPTAIRTATSSNPYLPAAGTIQLDSADAAQYQSKGLLDDIIEHEILHNLGVGSVWSYLGLVDGAGTSTPTFIGEQATNAYEALYPTVAAAYSSWGTGVPVENEGGSGTAGSHWDEQALTNELMTGYINNDGNPVTTNDNVLSDVTIASLGDLGYITILGATYMNVA